MSLAQAIASYIGTFIIGCGCGWVAAQIAESKGDSW